jgi:hypothetical protein
MNELGQSFDMLPLPQRLERYRHFAQHALKLAKDARDENMRAEFLSIASAWHALASEAERLIEAEHGHALIRDSFSRKRGGKHLL